MALAAIGRAASPNKHLLLMAHTLAVGHSVLRCCNSSLLFMFAAVAPALRVTADTTRRATPARQRNPSSFS
jgi:hypothetical protein